jgi:putative transposase
MAELFVDVLLQYRQQRRYLLHEFVVMPDHFHLLITPNESLERSLQLIKGGFSYRARKELGFLGAIWQPSYHDRRVRNIEEYRGFREYIHMNPVRRKMTLKPAEYRYCSAHPSFQLDGLPQRLRPVA